MCLIRAEFADPYRPDQLFARQGGSAGEKVRILNSSVRYPRTTCLARRAAPAGAGPSSLRSTVRRRRRWALAKPNFYKSELFRPRIRPSERVVVASRDRRQRTCRAERRGGSVAFSATGATRRRPGAENRFSRAKLPASGAKSPETSPDDWRPGAGNQTHLELQPRGPRHYHLALKINPVSRCSQEDPDNIPWRWKSTPPRAAA